MPQPTSTPEECSKDATMASTEAKGVGELRGTSMSFTPAATRAWQMSEACSVGRPRRMATIGHSFRAALSTAAVVLVESGAGAGAGAGAAVEEVGSKAFCLRLL